MSNSVAIFHGYSGHKPGSWLTWLDNELVSRKFSTIYPSFPPLGSSRIEEWYEHFQKYQTGIKEPLTIVGHSAGTTFALYLIEHLDIKYDKLVLVCPLSNRDGAEYNRPGIESEAPFIRTFVHQNFDFELIKARVKDITFILSDDDPNVPYKKTKKYFSQIFPDAKFLTLHNSGHINAKAGITELPQVLELVMADSTIAST